MENSISVYTVLVLDCFNGHIELSKEVFPSLEKAQDFCKRRGATQRYCSPMCFDTFVYRYQIYEMTIKFPEGGEKNVNES